MNKNLTKISKKLDKFCKIAIDIYDGNNKKFNEEVYSFKNDIEEILADLLYKEIRPQGDDFRITAFHIMGIIDQCIEILNKNDKSDLDTVFIYMDIILEHSQNHIRMARKSLRYLYNQMDKKFDFPG